MEDADLVNCISPALIISLPLVQLYRVQKVPWDQKARLVLGHPQEKNGI